jgi:hypothetical protein
LSSERFWFSTPEAAVERQNRLPLLLAEDEAIRILAAGAFPDGIKNPFSTDITAFNNLRDLGRTRPLEQNRQDRAPFIWV